MNKRGQTMATAIMTSIFLMIIGLMMVNFLSGEIDRARVNLSCASPDDISDGTKLLCLAIDGTIPYWIVIIFSLVIGMITARLNF